MKKKTSTMSAVFNIGGAAGALTWHRMVYLFTGILFVTFSIEAYLGHFHLMASGGNWIIWVPLIFSFASAGLSTLAFLWPMGVVQSIYRGFMWSSIFMGLTGMYFHWMGAVDGSLGGQGPGWLVRPPLFAPLSFLIPGLMGLIMITVHRRDEGS